MLAGLIAPSAGQLTIEGGRPGYMLQRDHLLDWRTIEGNIVLGLQVQGRLNPETREKAMALLETYGLADFAKSYPGQLSGGMRQKVALIRTLACSPDSPIQRRNAPEFKDYFDAIWKELDRHDQ